MKTLSVLIVAAAAAALGGAALAQELAEQSAAETDPPFGGEANVAYAENLWQVLEEARLVGSDGIQTYPYEGSQPHGAFLEFLQQTLEVQGHSGIVMVKRNYAGELEGEALEHAVLDDPAEYLDSVTVMFQREDGYDPETMNWFWAKYMPDGALAKNPQDRQLAGRVGKGGAMGCIPCHARAGGEDWVYTHDQLATE